MTQKHSTTGHSTAEQGTKGEQGSTAPRITQQGSQPRATQGHPRRGLQHIMTGSTTTRHSAAAAQHQETNNRHEQRRKQTAEHDSTPPHDSTAPQNATQGSEAPRHTTPNLGAASNAARQGQHHRNTTPGATRIQQETTDDSQAQQLTPKHNRQQHTTPAGARGASKHRKESNDAGTPAQQRTRGATNWEAPRNTAQGATAPGSQAAQQDNTALRPRSNRALQPATAADEARRDASTATKQTTQHRTNRLTTVQQSTRQHSTGETSTRKQRDRATPNSKTHDSRAPHRQRQPRAPWKGKKERKNKNEQRIQQHTTTEQKKKSTTRPSTTQARTRQNTKHTTDRSATRHEARPRTTQGTTTSLRGGGGGGQHNQHTTDEKKQPIAHGGGAIPHCNQQRGKTPSQRGKQNLDNTRRNSMTGPGATGQPQASTQGQRQAASAAEQDHRTKHISRTPAAAQGRKMPPARRHWTHATRQATTHREQAQPGSTERHSASANQPPPGQSAHSNTHQHTPQPRTHKQLQHRTTR